MQVSAQDWHGRPGHTRPLQHHGGRGGQGGRQRLRLPCGHSCGGGPLCLHLVPHDKHSDVPMADWTFFFLLRKNYTFTCLWGFMWKNIGQLQHRFLVWIFAQNLLAKRTGLSDFFFSCDKNWSSGHNKLAMKCNTHDFCFVLIVPSNFAFTNQEQFCQWNYLPCTI